MSTPFKSSNNGRPVVLYEFEGFSVNVLESEEHNRVSQMTEFTIENGSIVSDHVIQKPEEIIIRCEQTNVSSVKNSSGFDMALQAMNRLEELWRNRNLFTLYTAHQVYTNIVVVAFNAVHRQPYKGALKFTVTLKKVNFIDISTVDIPTPALSVKALATEQIIGTVPVSTAATVIGGPVAGAAASALLGG